MEPSRGRILGWNPDKSLKSFPSSYSQSPLQLRLEIYIFFKLTKLLTVSTVQLLYTVDEKGGNPDRKPYPLPYCLRNPYRNLKSEIMPRNLNKLYVHEFGFWSDTIWCGVTGMKNEGNRGGENSYVVFYWNIHGLAGKYTVVVGGGGLLRPPPPHYTAASRQICI